MRTHLYGSDAHKRCVLRASGNKMYLVSTLPDEMWRDPSIENASLSEVQHAAARGGISDQQMTTWIELDWDADAAVRLTRAGITPAEAERWYAAGRTRADDIIRAAAPPAREWTESEMERVKMRRPRHLRDVGVGEVDGEEAVSEYRWSDNAVWMNSCLRSGASMYIPVEEVPDLDDNPDRPYYQQVHETLLEVARQSRTEEPLVLHRGLQTAQHFDPGETISGPGWMSASGRYEVAEGFTNFGDEDGRERTGLPVVLTIDVPAGTHLVNTLRADVAEFVLPPYTELTVDAVWRDGETVRVRARVTGQR